MPNFQCGRLVATPAALSAIEGSGDNLLLFLRRHLSGDWGDLGADDKRMNDAALKDGSRLLSRYDLKDGKPIYIITEAEGDNGNRESTCVLLREEY
ncbi:hypothetical protein [Granulicella tundricola]|uniref:Type I restriction-modification system methyltransferase subunit n=1 Tax=Granulicella tundricola (strain ATCC BAA-1859 / DSM 23138 / MP5ACTX9) TaxID=1198114 RepID=E8X0P6_GRATM|nr:hypothetical protein [Granulicella tundricola]ADW68997.1 type I restriction-modification system methyltransferase subunit [Granulicella tundricola MP5ACTX9]